MSTNKKSFMFNGDILNAVISKYDDGTDAIILETADGVPYGTASVNLRDKIPSGFVAVKDYSENIGMLEALIYAKIIGRPEFYVRTGYVEVPVCKIL